MDINTNKGKGIISYLAAKTTEVRKQQISDLNAYVENRAENAETLNFVKYWGASDKKNIDKYDLEALIFLFGFLRIVEKYYKIETRLTLIFMDSHAILNGYNEESYKNYYKQISRLLNRFNYSHIMVSELLIPFLRLHKIDNISELINSIIQESIQHKIPESIEEGKSFELLKKSAVKHSIRNINNINSDRLAFQYSDKVAFAYIKLSQIEKVCIEKKFTNSFFLTYASEQEKELTAPNIPALQIFSCQKGMRSRPWFLNYENKIK